MKRTALIRRTPLRRVSKKRSAEARIYAKKRTAFLAAHPYCQAYLANWNLDEARLIAMGPGGNSSILRSVDVHHKAGRYGGNYLDESTWMAVSRYWHDWIHTHPSEARKRGWLV